MRRWDMEQGSPRMRLSWLGILAVVGFNLCLPAMALAADPLQGEWQGQASRPQGDLLIRLQFEQADDGKWTAQVALGDSLQSYDPLQNVSISGSAVSFRYRGADMDAPVIFSGNYQAWDDMLSGVFIVDGQSHPVNFARISAPPGAELEAGSADSLLVEEEIHGYRRHRAHFGIEGRIFYVVPIHILKDEQRKINDISTPSYGWTAGLRWYVLDGWALFARYYYGGQAYEAKQAYLDLYDFTGNEFLSLEGYEGGMYFFLGNALFPSSKFNPYVVFSGGKIDWSLGANGRGSEPYAILDQPLEGNDWTFSFGLGTEYPLGRRIALSLDWSWRAIFTQDSSLWDTNLWGNTQQWEFAFGLILNI